MNIVKKIINVFGILVSIVLSLALLVTLIAAPVVSGVTSLVQQKTLHRIVENIDFTEIDFSSMLPEGTDEMDVIVGELLDTQLAADVVDLYLTDVMTALDGTGAPPALTKAALQELVDEHMDEITPIVRKFLETNSDLLLEMAPGMAALPDEQVPQSGQPGAAADGTIPGGFDLENIDLNEILGKMDLSSVDLSNSGLKEALGDVDLGDVDLSDVDLSKIDLSGIDLTGADLSDIDLNKVLKDTDLGGVDLSGVDLNNVDLTSVTVGGEPLSNAVVSAAVTDEMVEAAINMLLDSIDDEMLASLSAVETLGLDEEVLACIALLRSKTVLTAVIVLAVVLSLLILGCRWPRFKGFMWLAVVYFLACPVVALAGISVSAVAPALLTGDLPELADVLDPVLSVLKDAMTTSALVYLVLVVVFVLVFVFGRKALKKKKAVKAAAAAVEAPEAVEAIEAAEPVETAAEPEV